jgi:hypothetical protein
MMCVCEFPSTNQLHVASQLFHLAWCCAPLPLLFFDPIDHKPLILHTYMMDQIGHRCTLELFLIWNKNVSFCNRILFTYHRNCNAFDKVLPWVLGFKDVFKCTPTPFSSSVVEASGHSSCCTYCGLLFPICITLHFPLLIAHPPFTA